MEEQTPHRHLRLEVLVEELLDELVEIKIMLNRIATNTAHLQEQPPCYAGTSAGTFSSSMPEPVASYTWDPEFPIPLSDIDDAVMWWDRGNNKWRPLKELTLRKEE